jgi:hypothetical protein
VRLSAPDDKIERVDVLAALQIGLERLGSLIIKGLKIFRDLIAALAVHCGLFVRADQNTAAEEPKKPAKPAHTALPEEPEEPSNSMKP